MWSVLKCCGRENEEKKIYENNLELEDNNEETTCFLNFTNFFY